MQFVYQYLLNDYFIKTSVGIQAGKYKSYQNTPIWGCQLSLVPIGSKTGIVSSCPAPPCMCEKGGSGVLNDFSCHSSLIRELQSDYRMSSSTRSSMPAVRCTCTGNAIITFFTPFDPAPCDKKCRSEHQTLFPLFGEGSGDETTMNTTFMDKS